jgi:RNA polymerase sigma factor (sigma-70 family)
MDSSNTSAQEVEQTPLSTQPNHPWLDSEGNTLPDQELRPITQDWSAKTWEDYLLWFENQNGQRAESLIPKRRYDEICDNQEESIFILAQSSADQDLKDRVSSYLATLTDQQRRALKMLFWESKSLRETAAVLGINHKAVLRLKKRALNKIRGLLKGAPLPVL